MAGQREVLRRYRSFVRDVTEQQTERALTMLMIQIGVNSASMIPVVTSNLINSEFRRLQQTPTGWTGYVGYRAEYARAVHDAPGTFLGTNTPRPKVNGIDQGNFWDPNGEPEYLRKGAEEALRQWPQILSEAYR